MAEFRDARAQIKTKFITSWAALHSDVPIFWPNENEELPDSPAPFLSVEIRRGVERNVTRGQPGSNLRRDTAEIIARIFGRAGEGEDAVSLYADEIVRIFRDYDETGVTCAMGNGGGEGNVDGNYYRMDVIIPFTFDHTA